MPTTTIVPCGNCHCCSPPGVPPCSPGCCKCPPTGNICFDILDCQAYYLAENPSTLEDNWYPVASCCTGMSFTLTHDLGYLLCNEPGHTPSTVDVDGDSCLTTGTGSGMPTGTGTGSLPELWGFSGTVCGDCTTGSGRPDNPTSEIDVMSGWEKPWFYKEECDGMCLKASLCCCVSPFGDGIAGQGNRCAGGATQQERTTSCACGISCYKFTMEPFDCHTIPYTVLCPVQTGTFKSNCSPCSYLQTPTVTGVFGSPGIDEYSGCSWSCEEYANDTGSAAGNWRTWSACEPAIARGKVPCGVYPYTGGSACSGVCPNESGTTSFMALVEGVYESQCDCATGVFDTICGPGPPCEHPPCPPSEPPPYPSGVGVLRSVFVKFTALLSEADGDCS